MNTTSRRRPPVAAVLAAPVLLGAAIGATLALVPPADAAAEPKPVKLASSAQGFSPQQGRHGWSYGYYADPSTAEFTAMPQYFKKPASIDCAAKVWYVDCGSVWTQIGKKVMHPQSSVTTGGRTPTVQWAVRRWTSPTAAPVRIKGTIAKSAGSCGDGVAGHIRVDGQEVWAGQVAANDYTGLAFDVPTEVAAGSTVDFVLDPLNDDLCDATSYVATITSR